MSKPASIDKRIVSAIDIFAGGFCFTRSWTHPYETARIDGLWVMRDGARKNAKDYRREEWLAYHRDAKEVDRIARANTRGRFVVCAFRSLDEPMESLRDEYKSIGYRLGGTEPFFEHDLKRIPNVKSPATIERVRTRAESELLGKAMRSRPIGQTYLDDESTLRQYAAFVDGAIVGWVSSVGVGKRNWVSNLFVRPALRGKNIGKALMARLLRDDRAAGSRGSVLLASHAGAKLYPSVGYEQIGELLLLTPKRR